jgi:hypothetical protein
MRESEAHSAHSYAARWHAVLAENSILHKEHLDLIASFHSSFFNRTNRAVAS